MAQDEQLEIVFWWMGGDSQHPIEDALDEFLDDQPAPRRSLRGRRSSRRVTVA